MARQRGTSGRRVRSNGGLGAVGVTSRGEPGAGGGSGSGSGRGSPYTPMGVFLLFCRLPSPPPPCQHLKRIHRDAFQVLAGSLLETRSMAHGGHVPGVCCLLCLCWTTRTHQCGVFLVFSSFLVTPFLGNFLFRYILFRYIYGVIDIIIYLFESFYLAPF